MTRYALLPFVACFSMASLAQSTPQQEALATIDRFFAAMTVRDTTAMASTILRDGDLHIASLLGGEPARTVSFGTYLTRLAQGKETFVERYWDAAVRVDGPLATATMPYDFHVDGAFSHCGVDIFTLVKGPDGWRIASVAYTRQTEGCPPSPWGPLKP